MDYWKVITGTSLIVLAYEIYQDYTKQCKPFMTESKKKFIKICLTGGP